MAPRSLLLLTLVLGSALARPAPPSSQQDFEQLVPSSSTVITEEELYIMIERMLMEAYGAAYEPPSQEYIQRYLNRTKTQMVELSPKPVVKPVPKPVKINDVSEQMYHNVLQNSIVRDSSPLLKTATIEELIRRNRAPIVAPTPSTPKQIASASLGRNEDTSSNFRPSGLLINPAMIAKIMEMRKKSASPPNNAQVVSQQPATPQVSHHNTAIQFPLDSLPKTLSTPPQSNRGRSPVANPKVVAEKSPKVSFPLVELEPKASIGSVKIVTRDSMMPQAQAQVAPASSSPSVVKPKQETLPQLKKGDVTSEELENALIYEKEDNQTKYIIVDRRTKSKTKPVS